MALKSNFHCSPTLTSQDATSAILSIFPSLSLLRIEKCLIFSSEHSVAGVSSVSVHNARQPFLVFWLEGPEKEGPHKKSNKTPAERRCRFELHAQAVPRQRPFPFSPLCKIFYFTLTTQVHMHSEKG